MIYIISINPPYRGAQLIDELHQPPLASLEDAPLDLPKDAVKTVPELPRAHQSATLSDSAINDLLGHLR